MSVVIKLAASFVSRFAFAVLELIEENIAAGRDANDNQFEPYSTRPFARPAGGIPKRARIKLDASGQLRYFTRGRSLWVVITGGYLALKRAINARAGARVDLTASGLMLQQIGVIRMSGHRVTIGFRSTEAAERAFYHNVTGAGRRHVIRRFLGLTDEKYQDAIETAVGGAHGGAIEITGELEV